jgi:hypothetical protein
MKITIDMSDFSTLAEELIQSLIEDAEETITDIFTDLTAPPPEGTPVDTGAARQGWQVDMSDPKAPEVYNTIPYINRLNDGHSPQTPAGFVDAIVKKRTD